MNTAASLFSLSTAAATGNPAGMDGACVVLSAASDESACFVGKVRLSHSVKEQS